MNKLGCCGHLLYILRIHTLLLQLRHICNQQKAFRGQLLVHLTSGKFIAGTGRIVPQFQAEGALGLAFVRIGRQVTTVACTTPPRC